MNGLKMIGIRERRRVLAGIPRWILAFCLLVQGITTVKGSFEKTKNNILHGLGTIVSEAPDSQKALELAGLDWNVIQKDIITSDGSSVIPGFKANVRDKDNSVLGIVTDRSL